MKAHLGSVLIALAIAVFAVVYACSQRYSYHFQNSAVVSRFDHWTGKIATYYQD